MNKHSFTYEINFIYNFSVMLITRVQIFEICAYYIDLKIEYCDFYVSMNMDSYLFQFQLLMSLY